MDTETSSRKPFTPAQLKASESLGFISPQDAMRRRQIVAHAIDNVTPDIASDRDDAIHVETSTNGHVQVVEVTIADVATHVPLDNPVAEVAHDRAITIYRPEMNDPQFPKAQEDRMSLEHQQPRLGLTVHSERNDGYEPTYVEFERTLIIPDNADYRMAQARMRHDPKFMLMRDTAYGIRQRAKAQSPEAYAEMKAARARGLSGSDLEASKMVETYMLDTNEIVATFMERSKLPFLYRNYEDDAQDEHGIARAYYSTRRKRHDALSRDGLSGAYCHFTSPIRRGADFYNAHVALFVIDGVEQLERELREAYPTLDAHRLHRALWKEAPDLFAELQAGKLRGEEHVTRRLAAIIDEEPRDKALCDIAERFMALKPPLSVSQLERYARQINEINHAEQVALQSPSLQRWLVSENSRMEVSQSIAGKRDAEWAEIPQRNFSTILRNAAKCQVMNDGLKREALRRIASEPGQAALTQDAFSILVVSVMPGARDSDWRELRKAACRAVRNHPSVVNNILVLAESEGYFPEGMHKRPASASSPNETREASSEESNHVQTRLLNYRNEEGQIIAAPYYSVGHDERSAVSHARYSFLEHYAFGQLQPVDQTAIPNLLYADLDQPDADRRKLVEQMAASLGATLRIVEYDRDGEHYLRAIVKGGDLRAPIDATAGSHETENIERHAIARLLRQPLFKNSFKEAISFDGIEEIQAVVKPYALLQKQLAGLGTQCETDTVAKELRGAQNRFMTTIIVDHGDERGREIFEGEGPNKDRALHDAATKALEHYGWMPENLARAGSWVTGREELPQEQSRGR